MPFINGTIKKKGIENLVFYTYLRVGRGSTVEMLDKLKEIGFTQATQAGFSLGIDDFVIPKEKAELVDKGPEGSPGHRKALPRRHHLGRRAVQPGRRDLGRGHRQGLRAP